MQADVPHEIAAGKVWLQPPPGEGGQPLVCVAVRRHIPYKGNLPEVERFIALVLDTASRRVLAC